jgi:predicted negative regulator of RcsB-dependent stress response
MLWYQFGSYEAYLAQGNTAQARLDYQQALAANPHAAVVQAALENLPD